MPTARLRPTRLQTLLDATALFPRQSISHSSIQGCPPGDGGPVLVLPGIFHNDSQSARFRDGLKMLDYNPFGWELGRNVGPVPYLMEGAGMRLARIAREHGPVRLIGFSLGGLFARFLAQSKPHLVRQVITICSPFRDPLNSAWISTTPIKPFWRHVDLGTLVFMMRQTPPMPWWALYSRIDGIVAWRNCLDPDAMQRCIEVNVRHRQALREASVLAAVARCLSQA